MVSSMRVCRRKPVRSKTRQGKFDAAADQAVTSTRFVGDVDAVGSLLVLAGALVDCDGSLPLAW